MSSSTRASHTLKSQDYHGLRRVSHPKLPIHHIPGYPDNAVLRIDDDWQPVARLAGHLTVYQQILQFPATHRRGAQPVSRATVPNHESASHLVFWYDSHHAISRRHI